MTIDPGTPALPPATCRTGTAPGLKILLMAGACSLYLGQGDARAASAPQDSPHARTTGAPGANGGSKAGSASRAENITVSTVRRYFHFQEAQTQPDSATRLTGETLTRKGVVRNTDLQNLAPNVTIQSLMGTASTNYFIRGIGMSDFTQNNMSSVMTYVDGVAFPLSTMSNGMMFDLANVDIVPGPVGTTHGMADSGGEVNIHTADPTDTWHGGVTEDIASYARSRTDLYVSGPLARNLSFRIAGQTMHGGGWQYSPMNHTHLGDAQEGGLRAKLRWTPDEKTEIMLTGHWVQDDSNVIVGRPVKNVLPAFSNPMPSYQQANWNMTRPFAQLVGRPSTLYPSEHNTFWGADLRMRRDLGFATLQSISAYETEREGEFTDQDGLTYSTGNAYRNIVANSFSQELRLASQARQAPLQWAVGAFYNRVRVLQSFYYDFLDYRGFMTETPFRQNQQTFSQYANLSYRLPAHVTLFGGITHESDDRQMLGLETNHYNASLQQIASLKFHDEGAEANQFSGNAGIQWQARRNLQLYFKVSKGFKPGGFSANDTVVQDQLTPFKPETVLAYEAGFKSDIIPNVFRLNGAAFYYDYHDQQILGIYVAPNYGTLGRYTNIPKSEVWGIEFNTEIHPVKYLFIQQNFGYERGKFQQFQQVNLATVDAYYAATGVWKPFYQDYGGVDSGIPKLTLNGSADYRLPVFTHYQWETGLDWTYRDSQALTPGGLGYQRLPNYFLLGAHMTYRPLKGPWSATVYATNLLNRQYAVAGGQTTTTYLWFSGEPRFIGGRVSLQY
ncbi:TonB-dependent receptor [Gluconacetobacter aggeris]|nr:TonB-dependent receptor [Gluconacetobacter aggeris]